MRVKHGVAAALIGLAGSGAVFSAWLDTPAAGVEAEYRSVTAPLHDEIHGRHVADAIESPPPYPIGRWRLANPTSLERVKLWVSHLLIRHEEVSGTQVCFGPPGWHAFPPPPNRTRGEALSLAISLATTIRDAPQRFAELARERSEDTVTRDTGGSLGGIMASELLSTTARG